MADAKKQQKRSTKYVVLRGPGQEGPFDVVGTWTTTGQLAAKRAAAEADKEKGHDPEGSFYAAVPRSSFYPEKPTLRLLITFSAGEDEEEEEVDEESVPVATLDEDDGADETDTAEDPSAADLFADAEPVK
jgi:hypothetical protein